MSLFTIDGNIHAQILGPCPVDFDLVKLGQGVNEVIHGKFIRPQDSKIINNQSKSNRTRLVAENRRRARQLVISICLRVSKQSLLAQSPSLWQPVVCFMNGTIHALFIDELLKVEEIDHISGDEACLDSDILGVR